MEYYKKTIGTKQYYYVKEDDEILHTFSPSATTPTLWIYNVNTLSSDAITNLLSGASTATRSELDTPINSIETAFNGFL